MNFTEIQRNRLATGLIAFLAIVSIYFVAKLVNEIKAGEYIGTGGTPNTITVAGEGEVFAAPDIATVTFTARGDGSTVKDAQAKQTALINKALEYLRDQKIADKDIKTSAYYTQPEYQYLPCTRSFCPVRQTKITGYSSSQTVEVKVRDIENVGEILNGLGNAGITEISGPNFAIDDEEGLKSDARSMAIKQARDKAGDLARDLGVNIVRVSSFQESYGGYPIFYGKDALQAENSAGSAAPEVPAGENKITVNVTIVYEIR